MSTTESMRERDTHTKKKNDGYNDGYYVKKSALSKTSINNFFQAFRKITAFFVEEDLSECLDFNCPKLNAILIKTRVDRPKVFSSIYDTLLKSSATHELIFNNKCQKIAAEFLNTTTEELYTHGIMMRMDTPGDTRNVYGWHQDSAYDGINSIPSHGVILWCPLVDTDIVNGTLIVCPKSHTEPNHTNDIQNGSPGISRQIITPNDIVSKYKHLSIPVKAGDSIVTYANLIHKSGENVSSSIRYTLLVRFNIITKNDFFLFN